MNPKSEIPNPQSPPVTRIVEPIIAPEVPPVTPAVEACPDCRIAGDEALAKSTKRNAKVNDSDQPV